MSKRNQTISAIDVNARELALKLNFADINEQSTSAEMVSSIYHELHAVSHHLLRQEMNPGVLQTTALLHDAYLRLSEYEGHYWQNREHFFAVAVRCMRRILIDYARQRNSQKRNGEVVTLRTQSFSGDEISLDLLDISDALDSLELINPAYCTIVELRFFAGMNICEVADAMDCSTATVKRGWRTARAWLFQSMQITAG